MDRRRGQIVLVAAFGLAIVFVTLALLLNTAIFTDHLATRETVDAADADDFQDSVRETGAVLLVETNQAETTEPALASTYREWVDNYSGAEHAHGIASGTHRTVSLQSLHNGTLVTQENETSLEGPNDGGTWQLADDVSAARAGRMTITAVDPDEPLLINATNGSATWELQVAESGDDFNVTVRQANGSAETRNFPSPIAVEPTNESIEGHEWPALHFPSQLDGSWELWIANGTNATGTYRFVLDQEDGTLGWTSGSDPGHRPVLYNATLDLVLEREDLDYRANVTVAPERRPA